MLLRKLEKYEIEEEIGHGGMATVYRAHDTVLDRLVALKVMHPHLRAAEEARKRFHREAQSVARLRHPKVLEIYDFSGEGSEEAYIAAELLTGPTLKQWREKQQQVPAEIAACFVIQIAQALEAAHEAKIIHRDVKPENVLLHEDRTIKLTDFGIADMVDAASMTATGQILGSPGHMAPEQIEGKDTDTRTDLFSLGTVLYYLATGRLPFTGRNPHQILKRIVDAEYADPLRVNPTIGGRMRAMIERSLAKNPDDRYQTATELREDLESFVRGAGIEDVDQVLEAYLKDPETIGKEIELEAIDRLIDRGSRASDAGDVPTALDCYNRVLALDEGNERVLKLIERVGLDRKRRALLMAGGGLIAVGLAASGVAWFVWSQPVDPEPIPTPIVSEEVDAGLEVVASNETDAGIEAVDAATRVAVAEDAGSTRVVGRGDRPTGPRMVRFVPTYANVTIAIAGYRGGAALNYGSQITTAELDPGDYQVSVAPRGESSGYVAQTIRVRVRAGVGDQRVALPLRLEDGRLNVVCRAPGARVSVAARATGGCNA